MTGQGGPLTEAALAALLGVHLAEMEARLDAWGGALMRRGGEQPAPPSAVPPSDTFPRPALQLTPLRHDETATSWTGWKDHEAVTLREGGVVELRQGGGTPGIASEYWPASGAPLLCIRVTLSLPDPARDPGLFLRVVNERGAPLGPDLSCPPGTSEHVIHVPARTQRLRGYLIALAPEAGISFAVQRIEALALDPGSHQARLRHDLGAPVIASMASIPDRREMLAEAVASLLPQCDRVRVFLNGYADVPEFLHHPRVEFRRSQDWDDKGDAGKFGWVDALEEPGYRIIVDDDLVFAPHFTRVMVEGLRRYGNQAFVALHGVLLRQPIAGYYAAASRSTFHFGNPLRGDRTVHVLGTNAFCAHSDTLKLRWADFGHRNMADIYVALLAQKRGIPMVALERPRHLAWQNEKEGGFDTIYDHSAKATRSRFDSSLVQDALIRRAWPLTLQPTPRPKVIFLLLAETRDAAQAALETWQAQAWTETDWVVILCNLSGDAALADWLDELRLPVELHLLAEASDTPAMRLARAINLAGRLGGRLLCLATEEIRFAGGEWVKAALDLLEAYPGAALLAHRGADDRLRVGRAAADEDGMAPCLVLAPPALLLAAGDVDPQQPDALAEWLARLALAQSASGSGKLPSLPDLGASMFCAPDHRPPPQPVPEPDAVRAKVGWRAIPPPRRGGDAVNDVFQRVCVINLDRRPDRWVAMQDRLARAGIHATRVAAVDGRLPGVAAEFEAYAAQPLLPRPTGVRPVTSSWQFYRDHDSQQARIAFEEARTQRKAIASAGALGYLITWQEILERALRDGVETLLVLDDDVAFHRDFAALLAAARAELPADWLVLQLGTLQYNWDREAITPAGRHLYRSDGAAIGSHAVGLRFEVFPFLLELVKRRDLPFDIGALAAATLAFRERCFVVTPNAAIQVLEDSDIGSSEFQKTRTLATAARTYRWHLPDYEL
ncbi:glycosyltransferase family 25 protein [Sediminicoccus sp. KRV36]|uniref:glycosyltransferase family 25 protein n=1 Tax=Sediminicoccus sp. KRV36 TaxID=3133721 RepID=UPI00200C0EC5|nr:glycosyltransferase family 25 protein [Sediminicoccus rosea]UPY37480.1 glycosyltransferase family 25 protein [Sediminicoccus rosea]